MFHTHYSKRASSRFIKLERLSFYIKSKYFVIFLHKTLVYCNNYIILAV